MQLKNSINDLIQLIYVGLIGCNKEIENNIKVFYEERKGISNPLFFFYEFLLHQPLSKNSNITKDNIWFFAPFIQRLAKKSIVGIDPKCMCPPKFMFYTERDIAKAKVVINFKNSIYMQLMYEWWSGNRNINEPYKMDSDNTILRPMKINGRSEIDHLFNVNIDGYNGLTINDYIKEDGKYVDPNKKGGIDAITWKSKYIEYGFIKPLIALMDETDKIPAIIIPVASKSLFYGELIVWLPLLFKEKIKEKDKLITDLGADLAMIIKKHYVPTLALLHEHYLERLVEDNEDENNITSSQRIAIDDNTNIDTYYKTPFCMPDVNDNIDCKNCSYWNQSDDEVENSMHDIWKRRVEKKINFKDSLVFNNYLISSPKMIDCLKKVLSTAKQLRMTRTSLPAILIVGGPGSGKDKIANLLRLFSEYYYRGELYTINMASIKPDALIAPIMMGGEMLLRNSGNISELNLFGILAKIREKTEKKLKENYKNIIDLESLDDIKRKEAIFPTLVLDELNSMHIDSQGILLRFIENAEIVPLGGIEDNLTIHESDGKTKEIKKRLFNDFLIIGIMNEDPEELSREKAIELVKKLGYVKGLMGDLLYEYLLKTRRLRPDLKYRMIRNGKFIIPDLKERKEDIPILFYEYTMRKEIPKILSTDILKGITIFLTIDALERLISPGLEWQGNVRQLQALAKQVAEISVQSYKEENEKNETGYNILMIRESHVIKGMEEIGVIGKNKEI